jgi:hypothetical protein
MIEVATDVDLDSEAEVVEPPRSIEQDVKPVQYHLELQLVEPIHKRHDVKLAELRMPLQHGSERRTSRLLLVVEEEYRARGQRRTGKDRRRSRRPIRWKRLHASVER